LIPLLSDKLAAVTDGREDLRTNDSSHVEDDAPVVEQEDAAGRDVTGEILVIEADALAIAEFALGVEDEGLTLLEPGFALGEFSDADLRSLEIGENADRPSDAGSHLAHQLRAGDVVLGLAVGKVEAHDIDAGTDHPFQDVSVRGGRTERGNDLGIA
jgi:hypothetical protein